MGKNEKRIVIISLFFIIVIVSIGQFLNASRLGDKLASYDPWYHLYITNHILETKEIIFNIPDAVYPTKISYFSLLYPLSAAFSLITGLSTFAAFQILGPFLLVLMDLGIFITIRRFTGEIIPSLMAVMIFSSYYEVLTRTTMNLPENYGLFFLILTIFILISNLRKELVFFPFLGAVFYHYKSIALLIFIVIIYLILSFRAIPDIKYLKHIVHKYKHFALILFLLCLPIIPDIIESYLFIITQHIGTKPGWMSVDPNPVIYAPYTLNDYLQHYGLLSILFSFIGFLILFYMNKRKHNNYLIFISFITTIVLTQSARIGLYIQPYRFAIYFSIFLAIVASLGISMISKLWRENKMFYGIFILTTTITFIIIVTSPHGWSGVIDADFEAIKFIKSNFQNDIVASWGAPYQSFDIPNSEWDPYTLSNIFSVTSERDLLKILKDRYGNNKKVILAVSYTGHGLLEKNNPLFLNLFTKYKIFEKNRVMIYEITI